MEKFSMKDHWPLVVLLILGLAVAVALVLLPATCLGQPLPDVPKEPPSADSWVKPTIGTGDIASLDEVVEGDIVCQQKVGDDYKLMPGGILMGEPKAVYFGKVKIAYMELRGLYEVDIAAWTAKLDVYKSNLDSAQTQIEKLTKQSKPSWWERNDFTIGLVLGVVLTTATAVGVSYAIGRLAD